MRCATVCSGIGAPETAMPHWQWQFCAEIEPFPSAVLAHHYPHVPNRGDMTRFKEWTDAAIDVLVGGTPCQSFSVAGLRKGLDDPRGNLALVFLALADRYRPEWVVWENVPGVLSSSGGRDFGAFLGGLGELGYGWAYRCLDAQWFGLAQRRKRVFVVGHLGDWRRAASVLFEPEGLRGDSAPSREAGEGTPSPVASGVALRGREGGGTAELIGDIATAMRASQGGGDKPHALVAHSLRGDGFDASEDGTGRGTPLVPVAFAHQQGGSMGLHTSEDCALALQRSQGQAIAFSCKDHGADALTDLSPTLRAGGHDRSHANGGVMPAVAFESGPGWWNEGQHTGALRAEGENRPSRPSNIVRTGTAVRRLTPEECESLQGFPRGFTAIPYRGKPAADGPRYKALGNSMAVPVVHWILRRVELAHAVSEHLEAAE